MSVQAAPKNREPRAEARLFHDRDLAPGPEDPDGVFEGDAGQLLRFMRTEEKRMYLDARARETQVMSEITRASRELQELYRSAKLGLGPDPLWLERVRSCEAQLVRLWELRRKALAEASWVLRQAARRRKSARSGAAGINDREGGVRQWPV